MRVATTRRVRPPAASRPFGAVSGRSWCHRSSASPRSRVPPIVGFAALTSAADRPLAAPDTELPRVLGAQSKRPHLAEIKFNRRPSVEDVHQDSDDAPRRININNIPLEV